MALDLLDLSWSLAEEYKNPFRNLRNDLQYGVCRNHASLLLKAIIETSQRHLENPLLQVVSRSNCHIGVP